MYLPNQPWTELGTYFEDHSLAFVPVGSVEQHGPHLPEATDSLIAEAIAREAADQSGYLCTAPIYIGVSPHHKQYDGTMWVDAPVFRDYVENLSRNLGEHGVDRIVYVNAHGGNIDHLREVGRRLYDDGAAFAIEWFWENSIPELVDDLFDHPGPHGGSKETAMIQHIADDLVREEKLTDARDGGVLEVTRRLTHRYGARVTYDTIDDWDHEANEDAPNGVFGDATESTPEKGEAMFEASVDQLIHLADWVEDQPFDALMPHDHL